jgi:hypothetical protein
MTQEEKDATVKRRVRSAKMKKGVYVQESSRAPIEGVLFDYAFNVSAGKDTWNAWPPVSRRTISTASPKRSILRAPVQLERTSGPAG